MPVDRDRTLPRCRDVLGPRRHRNLPSLAPSSTVARQSGTATFRKETPGTAAFYPALPKLAPAAARADGSGWAGARGPVAGDAEVGSPLLPKGRCPHSEVVPFRRTRREGGCGVVCGDSVLDAAEAAQKVGSGGVE